jgi:hypothetical protein
MGSQQSNGLPPLSKGENATRWAIWLLGICAITGAAGVYVLLKEGGSTGYLFTVSGLSFVGFVMAMCAKDNLTERRTDERTALENEKAQLEIEKLRLEIERLRRELDLKEPPAP